MKNIYEMSEKELRDEQARLQSLYDQGHIDEAQDLPAVEAQIALIESSR